ncbi:MAG: transposase [Ignavibacteria bacterium]|nr:transposase [Ignavibacteria bacterium]
MENENKKYPIRKSTRLKEYDYSNNGYYFITICVQGMKCVLSSVENNKTKLNKYGLIVENNLHNLQKRFPCIELDYYVVMPNHIHIILILENKQNERPVNITEIIAALKSLTTIEIHKDGLKEFKWQRSFYDRIIRDEKELYNIRKYIEQNPLKWDIEKNNPQNLEM